MHNEALDEANKKHLITFSLIRKRSRENGTQTFQLGVLLLIIRGFII
jgi:hypothetical protein